MKKIIFKSIAILIFLFNLNVFSQVALKDFPKKPKTGECYINMPNDANWVLIDCELAAIIKNKQLKAFQFKWKKLGYKIDTSGCIDKQTIHAFNKEKKLKRKHAKEKRDKKENKTGN